MNGKQKMFRCRLCVYWEHNADLLDAEYGKEQTPASSVMQPAAHAEKELKKGRCRRHAPRPSAFSPFWPITQAADWCGDFSRGL